MTPREIAEIVRDASGAREGCCPVCDSEAFDDDEGCCEDCGTDINEFKGEF
jgi:predicted amidophosphoribosyltransferase